MPLQELRPGELEALVVLMRSLTASRQPAIRPAERERRLRQGERVVRESACRTCHAFAPDEAPLRALHPRPSDRPPALAGEGAKVLPPWTFRYLEQPTALRPWLGLRMPDFNLSGAEIEAVAGFFAARDRASYPFTGQRVPKMSEEQQRDARVLFDKLQCIRCHELSNAPRLKPGELAPDLALTPDRLRRGWIRRFILEPQRLLPGTRMPTLFPLADEDDPTSRMSPAPELYDGDVQRQVEALVDILYVSSF
jgi:cytochrome c2